MFRIFLLLLYFPFNITANISYTLEFQGVESSEILELLQSSSQLYLLKETPPLTESALKKRAQSDLPFLVKALHSQALYNARVELKIESDQNPIKITFTITQGPVYPIESFSLDCDFEDLSGDFLGLQIGTPAFPSKILKAETRLLTVLKQRGYPLAKLVERKILIDQASKTVHVLFEVNQGPICKFGTTRCIGLEKVADSFIQHKIAWRNGDSYDSTKIEQTQVALDSTGLFSSVIISQEDTESDCISIIIDFIENKQRSIGLGVGYATQRGGGVAAEWEHRNMRGLGERLSFRTNLWKDLQKATLAYSMPDFSKKQDLLWLAEYEYERTLGYTQMFYSFSGIVENQLTTNLRSSIGGTFKHLKDSRSDNNRGFNLAKIPVQLRWSHVDNLLNPSYGYTVNGKIVPTLQLLNPKFAYSINTFIATYYHPLTCDNRTILAAKISLGSIIGGRYHWIPPSERFYSGTDNTLRGYRYMTVSPLNNDHKPRGGRSMAICSLETRYRMTDTVGLVAFYEIGNVYENCFPSFTDGVLQSIGTGVRYHTLVGPIRFDLAIPLNRRKHVDAPFQIYMSIGQTF